MDKATYKDESGREMTTEEVALLLEEASEELKQLQERHRIAEEQKLASVAVTLETKVKQRVSQRSVIEARWMEDLRQFHGYTSGYVNSDNPFKDTGGTKSKPKVNITRNKCKTAIAKMEDLQFPEKDKNYSIKPTPVPELERMEQAQGPQGDIARQELQRAGLAARNMEKTIWDQLVESHYGPEARMAIRDLVILGTGVMKGPMIKGDVRKRWTLATDADGQEVYLQEYKEEEKPEVRRVDPWFFYPDMQGSTSKKCEDSFELHPMSKKDLRKLMKHPGFERFSGTIGDILEEDPFDIISATVDSKFAVTGNDFFFKGRYQVWEYHGPLDEELLDLLGEADEDLKDPMVGYVGEVWFCNGKVIKVCLSHLEGDTDIPYAFTQWEPDETSPFGFGIPFLVRDAQRVVNSTWQMILDNSGLSAGPQVVVARETIEPANGKWDLEPMKIWYVTEYGQKPDESMYFFDIPSKSGELQSVMEMARLFSDEESSMPLMQQGEQSAQAGATATGMALLLNSSNVVQKSVNKNWDDNMTRVLIERMYSWNMLYNPKPEIKGDYKVVTLGATDLTNKQLQSTDLTALMQTALSSEAVAQAVNMPELLRQWAGTLRIDPELLIKSNEQLQAEAEAAAQNPPPDYEAMKLQVQMEKLELEKQTQEFKMQREIAELQLKEQAIQNTYEQYVAQAQARVIAEESEREQLLIKLASEQDKTVAQIMAQYQIAETQEDTKRLLAVTDIEDKRATRSFKREELELKRKNLNQGNDTFG